MKFTIYQLIAKAIETLKQQKRLPDTLLAAIHIERCRQKNYGDYSSNIALTLAKTAHVAPHVLAQQIVEAITLPRHIKKIEVAAPGFINFTLSQQAKLQVIEDILVQKAQFGLCDLGQQQTVHLEFVSANPTGPLHVGHGRSAAYGACVGNLLKAFGYRVHREYYVNNAGRQMSILTISVWLRYLQVIDETIELLPNAYLGDYIRPVAQQLWHLKGHAYSAHIEAVKTLMDTLNFDDQEKAMDVFIAQAKSWLGDGAFLEIKTMSLCAILGDIQNDLLEFGVEYDRWYEESKLYVDGSFEAGIQRLEQQGHVYEKDGARWFRATDLGDDKDRVLIRDNGEPTYFASDVAYHLEAYQKFDFLIDILGSDHHGYVPRLKAFLKGLGENPKKLKVFLVQFAILYRDGQRLSMSTRSGKFISLRQLRKEVGNDAARFFYIMRKPDQHLDFDLTLAQSKSNDNPVYYIQYAYARIASVMRKLKVQNIQYDQYQGLLNGFQLNSDDEEALIDQLSRYAEMLQIAAQKYAPHLIAHYLYELAHSFHAYYNAQAFIIKDTGLRNARLSLILATQQIIANAMALLGVSCPDMM